MGSRLFLLELRMAHEPFLTVGRARLRRAVESRAAKEVRARRSLALPVEAGSWADECHAAPYAVGYAVGYFHGPRYSRLRSLFASGSPTTTSFSPSHSRLRPSLKLSIPSRLTLVER
jgi:hypothetical protein